MIGRILCICAWLAGEGGYQLIPYSFMGVGCFGLSLSIALPFAHPHWEHLLFASPGAFSDFEQRCCFYKRLYLWSEMQFNAGAVEQPFPAAVSEPAPAEGSGKSAQAAKSPL